MITPSVTIQPAIAPSFGDLNTSRTSARPMISCLNSGDSIPLIACFTSSINW
ncbi:Uncharacterised protein [Vibrio cholerae]|nr:Uncharacterised protein [Vibrio cholerae]